MDSLLSNGWTPVLVATAASAAVMIPGGLLTETGPWYRALKKPTWQPPGWAFAPGWTLIYILVTWGSVLAWNRSGGTGAQSLIVTTFVLNGLLNIGWSLVFFKWRRPDWAFLEVIALWVSTVVLAQVYYLVDSAAGWLILPYIGWVAFAGYLNLTVVRLNGGFAPALPRGAITGNV
jgi:tryptophan-rich sensory protein